MRYSRTKGYIIEIVLLFTILLSFQTMDVQAQRFPKPEFESGHVQPDTQISWNILMCLF